MYSYDPTQPTLKDKARFYVGDTDMTAPLLSDAEYEATLSAYAYNVALATILESLANKVSAQPDEVDESGRVKVSWRARGQAWLENARRLREQGAGEDLNSPQNDTGVIGTMAVDDSGYRPHQNSGARLWRPWSG